MPLPNLVVVFVVLVFVFGGGLGFGAFALQLPYGKQSVADELYAELTHRVKHNKSALAAAGQAQMEAAHARANVHALRRQARIYDNFCFGGKVSLLADGVETEGKMLGCLGSSKQTTLYEGMDYVHQSNGLFMQTVGVGGKKNAWGMVNSVTACNKQRASALYTDLKNRMGKVGHAGEKRFPPFMNRKFTVSSFCGSSQTLLLGEAALEVQHSGTCGLSSSSTAICYDAIDKIDFSSAPLLNVIYLTAKDGGVLATLVQGMCGGVVSMEALYAELVGRVHGSKMPVMPFAAMGAVAQSENTLLVQGTPVV